MTTEQSAHRKNVNKQQLQVLYLLYKYRFATSDLLAQSQNITRRYMNIRLGILVDQGYIGRNFDSSYKLRNQHASYYLLNEGIKLLKEKPELSKSVLRNIAKDKNASNRFTQHSLNIYEVSNKLSELYGATIKFFTKSYLTDFDYFPEPLPDAYISFKKDDAGRQLPHIMLECFDSTIPEFVMKRRIDQYISHIESGKWTPKARYPMVLLICQTEELEQRVKKLLAKSLRGGWSDELVINSTTIANISNVIENT
jgi:DNA-binding HxlR family transcriptional regulator